MASPRRLLLVSDGDIDYTRIYDCSHLVTEDQEREFLNSLPEDNGDYSFRLVTVSDFSEFAEDFPSPVEEFSSAQAGHEGEIPEQEDWTRGIGLETADETLTSIIQSVDELGGFLREWLTSIPQDEDEEQGKNETVPDKDL